MIQKRHISEGVGEGLTKRHFNVWGLNWEGTKNTATKGWVNFLEHIRYAILGQTVGTSRVKPSTQSQRPPYQVFLNIYIFNQLNIVTS